MTKEQLRQRIVDYIEKDPSQQLACAVTENGQLMQYVFMTRESIEFMRKVRKVNTEENPVWSALENCIRDPKCTEEEGWYETFCEPIIEQFGSHTMGWDFSEEDEHEDGGEPDFQNRSFLIEEDEITDLDETDSEEPFKPTHGDMETVDIDTDHPYYALEASLYSVNIEEGVVEKFSYTLPLALEREDYIRLLMCYGYHRREKLSYLEMVHHGYIPKDLHQKIDTQMEMNARNFDGARSIYSLENVHQIIDNIMGEPPYHLYASYWYGEDNLTEMHIIAAEGEAGIIFCTRCFPNSTYTKIGDIEIKALYDALNVHTFGEVVDAWKKMHTNKHIFNPHTITSWLDKNNISYTYKDKTDSYLCTELKNYTTNE